MSASIDAPACRPNPFRLSTADEAWVNRTRDSLSTEDKVAQLFNFSTEQDDLGEMARLVKLKPGGLHRFLGNDLDKAWRATRAALENCDVPPLISGDIEGGTTSYGFATPIPNQLGIAACNDLSLSESLAQLVARESRAMGFDWSFTPVVDISAAFRSAIVGTRSYGSSINTIAAQACTYIRVLQANGMAATAKHWPGDGYDDRDQHLVTTVNPLTMDEWMASFGQIYREFIEAGVMTIMSAHIALPAWARQRGSTGREVFRPASLSRQLNEGLLRETLGFQGLIVSDATGMAGLTSWADREAAAPMVIENGCDMFLFSRQEEQDMQLVLKGLREGRLSEQRLHTAVTRVLSLKAALGLHRKSIEERLPPLAETRAQVRTAKHLAVADEAAKHSITLVKDTQALLPLDPVRHHRIVLITETGWSFFSGAPDRSFVPLQTSLEALGFELRAFDPKSLPTLDNTDLVLYLVGQESTPSASHIYLDWTTLHGGSRKAMIRFGREIPTMMVSFGHPYYLYDAPDMATYINAYCDIAPVQLAVVRKLCGEPFTGTSPVDAFCGLEQARY